MWVQRMTNWKIKHCYLEDKGNLNKITTKPNASLESVGNIGLTYHSFLFGMLSDQKGYAKAKSWKIPKEQVNFPKNKVFMLKY